MRPFAAPVLLAFYCATLPTAWGAGTEKPRLGQWEVEVTGILPEAAKSSHCVDDAFEWSKLSQAEALKSESACQIRDFKSDRTRVSFTQECKMDHMVKGASAIAAVSFNGDFQSTFSGELRVKMKIPDLGDLAGSEILTQIKGRYLGPCPKK